MIDLLANYDYPMFVKVINCQTQLIVLDQESIP